MFEDLKKIKFAGDEGMDFSPMFSISENADDNDIEVPATLALLALKNTVLFPGLVIPITVGRNKSKNAIKKAYETNKLVGVFSQRDIATENPDIEDLFSIGTLAKIVKLIKMPDGNTTAILQGKKKITLERIISDEPHLEGQVSEILTEDVSAMVEYRALISSIKESAKKIIELSPNIPSESILMLQNIKSDSFLMNFIASNLNVEVESKQEILGLNNPIDKATEILSRMQQELEMLEIRDQIDSKVKGSIQKQQRDYLLSQQLKTIQDELGQNPQAEILKEIRAKAEKKNFPEHVQTHFDKEMKRLERMNPQVAEYSILLNYMDTLISLPWNEYTEDNFDLKKVKDILDKDHHGLDDVKERILEHLAVLKLKGDMKAPILLLVGPPGVGKTSLGKSIASALGRKFIRMSLGGLHDESEIRGHRKTYIGAMAGRIIQSVKKAKSSNPVFILDEIDKIGKDFRGDPSSALLEVLDPEQNHSFYDNYLELEYDLSKIMFIATSNSLNTIQPALLDRMEVISLSGYSTEEKVQIAKKHLVPKQRLEHGLKAKDISLSDKVLSNIIGSYTRESGVRNLDRTLAAVMRNIAKKVAMNEKYDPKIKLEELKDILGPEKFRNDRFTKFQQSGIAIGLAWTRVGGDILYIEASTNSGKGSLKLTGNLGDVMKESATTALSYIKANAEKLGVDPSVFDDKEIHIHVPAGAIPKDGPSAGITMLTALTSVLTGKKVKSGLAMSGEITLRGKVLPVGGIKEKVLAAKRSGIKNIILCEDNRKDVEKINQDYLKGVNFHFIEEMDELMDLAF